MDHQKVTIMFSCLLVHKFSCGMVKKMFAGKVVHIPNNFIKFHFNTFIFLHKESSSTERETEKKLPEQPTQCLIFIMSLWLLHFVSNSFYCCITHSCASSCIASRNTALLVVKRGRVLFSSFFYCIEYYLGGWEGVIFFFPCTALNVTWEGVFSSFFHCIECLLN